MATNNQDLMKILGEISDTLAGLSKSLAETYPPGTQVPSSISDPLKALLGGPLSGLGGPSSGSSGGGYYTPPKNNYQNSYYSAPPTPPSLSSSTSYTGSSIVDYLNLTGQPSGFSSRAKLAQQYGIPNYTGTAAQNTQLLNLLRSGSTLLELLLELLVVIIQHPQFLLKNNHQQVEIRELKLLVVINH